MIREISLQGTKLVGIDDYKTECNDPILYCGVSDGAWESDKGRTRFVKTLITLSLLGHISRTSSPNVNSVS